MTRTARFIAAEDLGAASPWTFARMGAPVEQAPLIRPEAVRDARSLGYSEGHAAGLAEGAARVRAEMQAMLEQALAEQAARFGTLFDAVQSGLAQAQQDIARGSLEIACAVARQVLRRELATGTDGLRQVVDEAVQALLEDGRPGTLSLSPDDHARIGTTLAAELAERQVSVVADPALRDGDCMLATAANRIDAGVAQRWTRAVGSLGLDIPWEPEPPDTA
jgi:flagellar assembly protein FliH